jgi:MoxR-like ATPase
MAGKASEAARGIADLLGELGSPVTPAVAAHIRSITPVETFEPGKGFYGSKKIISVLSRVVRDPGHTLLFGPPGTGKSTAARVAFEQIGMPYVRISCHPGMDADEFIGTVESKVSPEGRQLFEAKWGPMVGAAEAGTGIVLEEVNSLLPERSFALFSLLDDSRGFLAQVCGSERLVAKHPGFRVIATANDNGTGEHMAEYAGIQVMNSALLDRFSRHVRIGYLEEKDEVSMLCERSGVPEAVARKMVALASETRTKAAGGEGLAAVSPRALIAWAISCLGSVGDKDGLTWWDTAEFTIANRQESHNAAVLRKMVIDRFTAGTIAF